MVQKKTNAIKNAFSSQAKLTVIFIVLFTVVALLQFIITIETAALHHKQELIMSSPRFGNSLPLSLQVNEVSTIAAAAQIEPHNSSKDKTRPAQSIGSVPGNTHEKYRTQYAKWQPHSPPVDLELRLTESVWHQPAFQTHDTILRQYGFNLNVSNHIPLVQPLPDMRNPQCKARIWPPVSELPKVSVIIIFYNEPLSTLLRNVVSVLNRTPPELLGEILLVDDHSKLDELSLLPEHLERLEKKLPPEKVRLVRRDVHNGIVGARIKGAEEARYPVIVILDSHAQVTDGWLEPLVGRIHGDRKRVVVPNLIGIDIESLDIYPGGTWPPSRGYFNWRLTFDIVHADSELDVVEKNVDKKASAIKTPVMPGGLFAMDRDYFFELGAYDPEILYYGAEHVEMSFRIWMCGGSMETMPCSNIGHIYRQFDRFAVDPQLAGVDIGQQLNVNDGRVAEVWMDDYKQLLFSYRPMNVNDLGDMQPRKLLRKKLQCKSFQWFLDNVCRDMYAPDFNRKFGHFAGAVIDTGLCIDGCHHMDGPIHMRGCDASISSQQVYFSSHGYLEFSTQGQKHICIRTSVLSQLACDSEKVAHVEVTANAEIRSLDKPGTCFTRMGEELTLSKCDGTGRQKWLLQKTDIGHSTLSDKEFSICLDNMQKDVGQPGLYGCHGGLTQQWDISSDGKIAASSSDGRICLGLVAEVGLSVCAADDPGYQWVWEGKHLKPVLLPELCLQIMPTTQPAHECRPAVTLGKCGEVAAQDWSFTPV